MHQYPESWFENVVGDRQGGKRLEEVLLWRGFPVVEADETLYLARGKNGFLNQDDDIQTLNGLKIGTHDNGSPRFRCSIDGFKEDSLRNAFFLESPDVAGLGPGNTPAIVRELDPAIALLIEVCNLKAIKTTVSCSGHSERQGYIRFQTSNDVDSFKHLMQDAVNSGYDTGITFEPRDETSLFFDKPLLEFDQVECVVKTGKWILGNIQSSFEELHPETSLPDLPQSAPDQL